MKRVMVFGATCLLLGCTSIQHAPSALIPDEDKLKARVSELYRAARADDEQGQRALVLPQIIECGQIDSPYSDMGSNDHHHGLELVDWRITQIEFDLFWLKKNTPFQWCPGKLVRASAGAMVTVEQTDQRPGEAVSKGDSYLPWLYVDGTWYWLIDVD